MRGLRFRSPLAAAAALSLAAALAVQPVAGAPVPVSPGGPQAGPQAPERVILVLSAPCTLQTTGAPVGASGVCAQQAPVLAQLEAAGANVLATTSLVDTITALVPAAEVGLLSTDPAVARVVPDDVVPNPAPALPAPSALSPGFAAGSPGWRSHGPFQSAECGTRHAPELDPQALSVIDAPQAHALGFDGAGVTVALLADGLDPTNPDFARNRAYGTPGSAVITQYRDFSGDGTSALTDGAEAFGDASSIAAQGNQEYNLSLYVGPAQAARLPAGGCWVKIGGAAPGANVLALKVFAQNGDTTTSGFLQAIQYAVQNGAKVINESFGSSAFPDTSLDVIRDANDAAVAAGVTVVVGSGDAGPTSTISSPATDPQVISVGVSTTFRSYAQADFGGFDNPAVGNGRWADDNISSASSGGFAQSGNTVDLVAPGDANWALCSTDTTTYAGCADLFGGTDKGVQQFGGASESSPLTAAAAADVIQAYARTHGGTDPAPALVKEILTSSATDIYAPASEQGAGLLNVLAAVKLAASLPPTSANNRFGPPAGGLFGQLGRGLLVSPSQVNVVAPPGSPASQQISLTNPGPVPVRAQLSTRALNRQVYDSGAQSFTMSPGNPTTNSGTFQIWSGVTEVYQTETFRVPPTYSGGASRLLFSADYQDSNQTSLLHFALYEPDGTYAAYSEPQGLGDYGEVEVADPPPGIWTGLFFTEQDGATVGGVGTSGPVQWDASTWQYGPAGSISPSWMTIPAGQSATATLTLTTPAAPGDTDQSVVISSPAGQTTVPVTVRTTVPLGPGGGNFTGLLTGGNGRTGVEAATNTYVFSVPPGETDLDASVALANDPGEELIAYLVDPSGQTVGYSSNYTLVPSGTGLAPGSTPYVELCHLTPEAGQWALVLEWENPVTGNELDEPFSGAVQFNQVSVDGSDLPDGPSATLAPGQTADFSIAVENTGVAPEAFFVDPRLDQTVTLALANQNSSVTDASDLALPLPAGLTFPYYVVPTNTAQLDAGVTRLSGAVPVTFDLGYFSGDPDVSPDQPAPGVTASTGAGSAGLTLTEPGGVSPGLWFVNPDEVGPYPSGGATTDTAGATLSAVTQAFDPAVSSSTDDFWQLGFAASNFLYLLPGQSGSIDVSMTPTAAPGTNVSGTLYVDDYVLASLFSAPLPNGDELASVPYSYTVGNQ